MMRRRPTAQDRELADIWRTLNPGLYELSVVDTAKSMAFMNLARLKTEGGTSITLDNGIEISLMPRNQEAA